MNNPEARHSNASNESVPLFHVPLLLNRSKLMEYAGLDDLTAPTRVKVKRTHAFGGGTVREYEVHMVAVPLGENHHDPWF